MSHEVLRDPEDLQKYPNQLLAQVIVNGLVLCAQDQIMGAGPNPGCKDSFRLTTFTKAADERLGDALAISAPLADADELISCNFYRVDRNDRQVLSDYPKRFSISTDISATHQLDFHKEKLIQTYDKDELESAVILLSRASKVYDGADNRHDKIVFNAVTESYLDELAKQERTAKQQLADKSDQRWRTSDPAKLIRTAERVVAQKSEPKADEIALQYEHYDGSFYLVRLKHYLGSLTTMTIARQSESQTWRAANLDLDGTSNDEVDNPISGWDEEALINAVSQGSPIDQQLFDMYLNESTADSTVKPRAV